MNGSGDTFPEKYLWNFHSALTSHSLCYACYRPKELWTALSVSSPAFPLLLLLCLIPLAWSCSCSLLAVIESINTHNAHVTARGRPSGVVRAIAAKVKEQSRVVCTSATAYLAASARISAQETTPGQRASTACLALSMT
uniref:Uncharacterized protein n=1 Tax=Arundo donax TaxID=35708 RepID=A0A0A9DRX0_ARUDO